MSKFTPKKFYEIGHLRIIVFITDKSFITLSTRVQNKLINLAFTESNYSLVLKLQNFFLGDTSEK